MKNKKKAKLRVLTGGNREECEKNIFPKDMELMSAGDLISFITDTLSDAFPLLEIEAVEIVKLPKGPFNIYVCGKFKGAPIRCQSGSLRGGLQETAKELETINKQARKQRGSKPTLADTNK